MPINVRRAAGRAVRVVGVVGGGEGGGEGSRKRKRGEEEGKGEGEDGEEGVWGMVEVECGVVGMRVLEDDDEDVRFEMTSLFSSSSSSFSTLCVPARSLVLLWEGLVERYGDSNALFQISLEKLIQPGYFFFFHFFFLFIFLFFIFYFYFFFIFFYFFIFLIIYFLPSSRQIRKRNKRS